MNEIDVEIETVNAAMRLLTRLMINGEGFKIQMTTNGLNVAFFMEGHKLVFQAVDHEECEGVVSFTSFGVALDQIAEVIHKSQSDENESVGLEFIEELVPSSVGSDGYPKFMLPIDGVNMDEFEVFDLEGPYFN